MHVVGRPANLVVPLVTGLAATLGFPLPVLLEVLPVVVLPHEVVSREQYLGCISDRHTGNCIPMTLLLSLKIINFSAY